MATKNATEGKRTGLSGAKRLRLALPPGGKWPCCLRLELSSRQLWRFPLLEWQRMRGCPRRSAAAVRVNALTIGA